MDQTAFKYGYESVPPDAWSRYLGQFLVTGLEKDMRHCTPDRWRWAMSDPDWSEAIMLYRLRYGQ